MPDGSTASSLHTVALRLTGLPPAARMVITLSDQMPDARFVVGIPGAVMRVTAQPPNLAFYAVDFRLQPQRLELQFETMPPSLLFEFTVQCGQPFLVGSLEVPEETHANFITPVATVRTYGGGYWAVPLRRQQNPTNPPAGRTEVRGATTETGGQHAE